MQFPYFQVDAFTGPGLRGNPAGVCLLEEWLPDAELQLIAEENNLADTAFVTPADREGVFGLRWFTPKIEVPLCGHATLAAGFVLLGIEPGRAPILQFATLSGRLSVRKISQVETGDTEWLELDFPCRRPLPCNAPALANALGCQPVEVLREGNLIMAVYERDADVRELQPDYAALAALAALKLDALGVIVTAPSTGQTEGDADFVSRFFAPAVGIPEDHVTGSAHCLLVPYWVERLRPPENRLCARQISPRGGELRCQLRGDRVAMAGRVKPYLIGKITWK